MKVIDYKEAKDKYKPAKLVQITSLQTLADLAYVKELYSTMDEVLNDIHP